MTVNQIPTATVPDPASTRYAIYYAPEAGDPLI
jgi:hypothetical protein